MPITLTRSLLVILIPGGVAAAPWLALLALVAPPLQGWYDHYPVIGDTVAFALFVLVGSFFEGINTWLETRWDGVREAEYQVKEHWYGYLAHTGGAEPVGFRYISRLATTLYFELSMMWASALFWCGIAACAASLGAAWFWSAGALLLAPLSWLYFHWQAGSSHRVLCAARAEILKRMF